MRKLETYIPYARKQVTEGRSIQDIISLITQAGGGAIASGTHDRKKTDLVSKCPLRSLQ